MSLKKILIVEDNPDTAFGYHIFLKAKNYNTCFAKDPLSCLSEAYKSRPDGILMDLGLAVGDGFRAMEQLKAVEHLAATPIIVVSCRDARQFAARALEMGAKAYLEKPFDQRELLMLINEHIGESCGQVLPTEQWEWVPRPISKKLTQTELLTIHLQQIREPRGGGNDECEENPYR